MNANERRAFAVTLLIRLVIAASLYALAAAAYGGTAAPPAWLAAVATAAVAATMWATRDWVVRTSTRIALGPRAGSYDAVHNLLQQLTDAVAVDDVAGRLAEVAGRAVGGPSAQVRVWMSDGEQWSRTWPPDSTRGGASLRMAVAHSGTDVGEIEVHVDPTVTNAFDRRLLGELAGPAGVALSTVRMTHDLRRRRSELAALGAALAASRDRLLTARRDEQRRLRKEVQDRVVPHLDSGLALVAEGDLAAVSLASAEALDALRLIARGIFPPRLGDANLAAAIDGWLERADLYAEIDVDERLAMTPEVEVCLYFCAATALSALAAAGADSLRVALRVDDQAVLTVSGCVTRPIDADARTVISDRVQAFDGTVTFDVDAVRAELPWRDSP
jgi:hypothetical protein